MDKDLDNTRDYDITAVHDRIRARVILTKDDSRSAEAIERATKKVIAILCTIFGTDISKGRLRFGFDSGGTNHHSTGMHRAFHFTVRYRYQCRSNGENQWGTTKIKTIPVEWQIQLYMGSEERVSDHAEYASKKDRKICRETMSLSWPG